VDIDGADTPGSSTKERNIRSTILEMSCGNEWRSDHIAKVTKDIQWQADPDRRRASAEDRKQRGSTIGKAEP
ncbi:MAG: hypothetical protein Q8K72_12785, partial [Acidimicrobiales bacterium]|nr:hypothetical protein [Acidimicrobiales bacterium]